MVPSAAQLAPGLTRWRSIVDSVAGVSVSPYDWRCPRLSSPLVIMDCFGYTRSMEQEVLAQGSGRVLLPRTVAAAAVAELMAG
jgi:hypothetical protein